MLNFLCLQVKQKPPPSSSTSSPSSSTSSPSSSSSSSSSGIFFAHNAVCHPWEKVKSLWLISQLFFFTEPSLQSGFLVSSGDDDDDDEKQKVSIVFVKPGSRWNFFFCFGNWSLVRDRRTSLLSACSKKSLVPVNVFLSPFLFFAGWVGLKLAILALKLTPEVCCLLVVKNTQFIEHDI